MKVAIGFLWVLALAPFASIGTALLAYRFLGVSGRTASTWATIGFFGLPISVLAVLGSPLLYYRFRREITSHRGAAIFAWVVLSLTTLPRVVSMIMDWREMMRSAESHYVENFLFETFTLRVSAAAGPPYRQGYGPTAIDVSRRQYIPPVAHIGGWFLMRPPLDGRMQPDPDAPMSAWAKLGSFETERDCREALALTVRERRETFRGIPDTWQSPEEAEANRLVKLDFDWALDFQCVPADATPEPVRPSY